MIPKVPDHIRATAHCVQGEGCNKRGEGGKEGKEGEKGKGEGEEEVEKEDESAFDTLRKEKEAEEEEALYGKPRGDGDAEAPSGSTQQRPDRMTWPNKRPNFWRRPSASPERASERAAADGPAVDDDDACNSSDSSLRGRITSLRRSIAARRRSPSPNPARGVAVPDAAVEAVPDPPPAVCLATHATHQHDTPREPSPEKQARRRRDGSSIN